MGFSLEAVRVARECGFGVTGNFIIDPDFSEENFFELWEFIEAHQLFRVGFQRLIHIYRLDTNVKVSW